MCIKGSLHRVTSHLTALEQLLYRLGRKTLKFELKREKTMLVWAKMTKYSQPHLIRTPLIRSFVEFELFL